MRCWIITEGIAGTQNQCIGVAEALGIKPDIKQIALRQPWKSLSPYLGFEQNSTFSPALEPPWPDLLIASGRKSIAAARYIKKQNPGTFTVQIQDPRINPANFDLVCVPEHDPTRGENVITTIASPNRITPKKLAQAREQFKHFETIKTPRVTVLIGGNSKAYTMAPAITKKLSEDLQALDAGLMITASRRTGPENERILKDTLTCHPRGSAQQSANGRDPENQTSTYFWDGTGENPYFGLLAWADYILVTTDSASMLSEAATTGKPVYMINLEGGAKRIDKLHENLINHGAIRKFEGSLEHWTYTPLNDAQKIAETIKQRI